MAQAAADVEGPDGRHEQRQGILRGEMPDGRHMSLYQALTRYVQALVAATVTSPQGRLIPDVFGALVLSEAADELYLAIAGAMQEMSALEESASGAPPGLWLEEASSPDGPWEPIPADAIRVRSAPLAKGDPQVGPLGALIRGALASGFPADLWNACQAANPGGDHNRYRAGDLVAQQDFELAASAERLLALGVDERLSTKGAQRDSRPIDLAKIVVLLRPSPHAPLRDASRETATPERGNVGTVAECEFRLCGEMWRLNYRGEEVCFPHRSKSGFLYIRELVRNQGKYLFAVDVAAVMEDGKWRRSMSSGDAVVDQEARLAYRARYSDLTDELEEAMRNNDEGRAISAQNDMDQLEAQLRESCRLGGRDRRMGDEVEKTARRVSMAVRRAIKQVEGCSRPLANHLRNSLDLGRVMIYRPEAEICWIT